MKRKKTALYLTRGAIVAALYVVLTFLSSLIGLDKGVIQLRFSEALCILPVFLPEAVPGLFVGCIIANIATGSLIFDVIFGSLATLVGAIGARLLRRLPKKLIPLATLPTVVANTLTVPLILKYAYGVGDMLHFIAITVGIGELISATLFGSLLYASVSKNRLFGSK